MQYSGASRKLRQRNVEVEPANILLPHQLIHAGDSKVRINIGYPGTKFIRMKTGL